MKLPVVKLPAILKSITLAEILIIVIFIVYLILPVPTPNILSPYIESPLGMIVILLITIALFVYSNPILAVLYIFVGYTLLRRSSVIAGQTAYIQHTPSKMQRAAEIKAEVEQNINLPPQPPNTLEEEVISKMAPIGKSELSAVIPSGYKPVLANSNDASPV